MQDNIKFFALGGLDENGKNLFVFEINNNIFIIEAGMKYPDKHTPGVDVIIPDFSYLFENKDRVKAYIISHGHDDQKRKDHQDQTFAYVLEQIHYYLLLDKYFLQ